MSHVNLIIITYLNMFPSGNFHFHFQLAFTFRVVETGTHYLSHLAHVNLDIGLVFYFYFFLLKVEIGLVLNVEVWQYDVECRWLTGVDPTRKPIAVSCLIVYMCEKERERTLAKLKILGKQSLTWSSNQLQLGLVIPLLSWLIGLGSHLFILLITELGSVCCVFWA